METHRTLASQSLLVAQSHTALLTDGEFLDPALLVLKWAMVHWVKEGQEVMSYLKG